MIFLVLTRSGYEELLVRFKSTPTPLWVNQNVLTDAELDELRKSGVEVSNFSYLIDATNQVEVEEAAYTVNEHHLNNSVWVEYVPNL